jgi:hypothetical protein
MYQSASSRAARFHHARESDNDPQPILLRHLCGSGFYRHGPVVVQFAREVSSRVVFLDDGLICEQGPERIFTEPSNPRTQAFLKRIIDAGL